MKLERVRIFLLGLDTDSGDVDGGIWLNAEMAEVDGGSGCCSGIECPPWPVSWDVAVDVAPIVIAAAASRARLPRKAPPNGPVSGKAGIWVVHDVVAVSSRACECDNCGSPTDGGVGG